MVTVRRDVSQCTEERALIIDDLNAPPPSKVPSRKKRGSALWRRRQATFVADYRPAQRRCDATHPGQRTDSSYERMKREGEGRYHSSHATQVAEARPANTHISRAEKRRTCDQFCTRARFLYPRGVTLDLTTPAGRTSRAESAMKSRKPSLTTRSAKSGRTV